MNQIATCGAYSVVADKPGNDATQVEMQIDKYGITFDKKAGISSKYPTVFHGAPNSQDWKNAITMLTSCAVFAHGANGVSDRDAKHAMLAVLEAVLNEK